MESTTSLTLPDMMQRILQHPTATFSGNFHFVALFWYNLPMQRIQCLTLSAVVLLLCVSGCGREQDNIHFAADIVVDGKSYPLWFNADVDRKGRITASLLRVHLTFGESYSEIAVCRGTTFTKWIVNGEDIVAKTETLYYLHDGVVFEKTYQELGIDLRQMNADSKEILKYLLPVLEKLIRENVQSQEPKREEPL